MTANFDFLKKADKTLFDIIDEAEKLYRDEYFDQCMTQTRRFGENVCKSVLGNKKELDSTFDEMLATLKDYVSSTPSGKEFIDDLYFLKKHGNESAHSSKVSKSGIEALECLQRAFEIALNYCVYSKNQPESILKLRYDTELLITGKKSKKTLAEKYTEKKSSSKLNNENKKLKSKPQYSSVCSSQDKGSFPIFKILVCVSSLISLIILVYMSFIK